MVGMYGKVINISPPSIVAAEDRSEEGALVIRSDQAHVRISFQIELAITRSNSGMAGKQQSETITQEVALVNFYKCLA